MTYAKRARAFDSHVKNCRECQDALMASMKWMLCETGMKLYKQLRDSQGKDKA